MFSAICIVTSLSVSSVLAVAGPVPACAFVAIPLSRLVYAAALVAAAVARTVAWRGITYRVTRPHRIRLIDDVPFLPAVAGGRASLI